MTLSLSLFQERWKDRPFWMLVGCVLVNRTQWRNAEAVHATLFRRYRSARGLAGADFEQLRGLVSCLGFGTRRAQTLIKLAGACSRIRLRDASSETVARLPGCGAYARDSWAIFMEGRFDVDPTDKRLRYYMAREGRWRPLPRALRKTSAKHEKRSPSTCHSAAYELTDRP